MMWSLIVIADAVSVLIAVSAETMGHNNDPGDPTYADVGHDGGFVPPTRKVWGTGTYSVQTIKRSFSATLVSLLH